MPSPASSPGEELSSRSRRGSQTTPVPSSRHHRFDRTPRREKPDRRGHRPQRPGSESTPRRFPRCPLGDMDAAAVHNRRAISLRRTADAHQPRQRAQGAGKPDETVFATSGCWRAAAVGGSPLHRQVLGDQGRLARPSRNRVRSRSAGWRRRAQSRHRAGEGALSEAVAHHQRVGAAPPAARRLTDLASIVNGDAAARWVSCAGAGVRRRAAKTQFVGRAGYNPFPGAGFRELVLRAL